MTGTIVAPPAVAPEPEQEYVPAPQSRASTVLRFAALVAGTSIATAFVCATAGWQWAVVIWSVIVIIMLHELGHFATAKWSGMKATEFFVGFGPRLWSFTRGETEYGFKALPLGGYVKILGMTSMEELDPSDEPRSFVNQSTSKRVLVASAGSIVHFTIALLLAIGALWVIGSPGLGKNQQISGLTHVAGVTTAAEAAGLRVGDQIVRIDGVSATPTAITSAIEGSNGAPVTLVIDRDGAYRHVTATPTKLVAGSDRLYLGISFGTPRVYVPTGFTGAVTGAGSLVGQVTSATFGAFWHAWSPHGISSLANQVTSPHAAAQARASGTETVSMWGALLLAVDALKAGPMPYIGLLISLNISLGVLNMLPMLPLDGGHVAIALYERIRTRKGRPRYRADVAKLMPVVYAFLAFLLLFVAGKMYLDIAHGVANPFK